MVSGVSSLCQLSINLILKLNRSVEDQPELAIDTIHRFIDIPYNIRARIIDCYVKGHLCFHIDGYFLLRVHETLLTPIAYNFAAIFCRFSHSVTFSTVDAFSVSVLVSIYVSSL